ncbi:caspase domain-containing protein [Rhodocollybia butyracea]|uniref:Caspase domain-containing protein n=1 Tax=Rhodocollybia butyracea TaxID=206335 RepID=A0A9P5PU83_9AGAR|nr:caspase domain-containing protein [Rhodocollybia butyracea]
MELLWYLLSSPPPSSKPADPVAPPKPVQHKPPTAPPTTKHWWQGNHTFGVPHKPVAPPHPHAITRPPPSLWTLIIGINEYADKAIPPLNGAVPDAESVNEFLRSVIGVPKEKIRTLYNKQATRYAIETALKDLAINPHIKKTDPILIFYAGHGAQAQAPKGWPTGNPEGTIQMLVPYDFAHGGSENIRRGQGVLDVTLSHLLADLALKKSDNITVILDCCHSGSGTRKDETDPSYAMRGFELPKSYIVPKSLLNEVAASRATAVAQGFEKTGIRSHVLLAACTHNQLAQERQGRGMFTSELLSLLKEKGVDKLSYNDVVMMLPDLPAQNPQCEGFHSSRILFNAKVSSPQRDLYAIRAGKKTGEYILAAGEAHGITANTKLAVYSNKDMSGSLGTVTTTSMTSAFETTCTAIQAPFELLHPGHALVTHVGEGEDVRLLIEPSEALIGVFTKIAQEMQATEAAKRGFRLVDSVEEEPDLIVTLRNGRVHFEVMDKLCRQYGLEHMPFDIRNDADLVHRVLRSAADFYWHLHRSSKDKQRLSTKVTFECFELKETGEYNDDFEEVLMPDPECSNLNVGGVVLIDVEKQAMYGFKITNNSNVDIYISAFYFDMSDLSIEPYYQPGKAGNGHSEVSLPAKKSLTIGYGDSGTPPYSFHVRENQDIDVGYLKVFMSTKYIDYSSVAQKSPFDETRVGEVVKNTRVLWDTLTIAIVQGKKDGGSARGLGQWHPYSPPTQFNFSNSAM